LLLLASQGREEQATSLIDASISEVSDRREGQGVAVAHCARAILLNGLGRYGEALEAARSAGAYQGDLAFRNWSMPELVEAAVRTNDAGAAADALEKLTETTRACQTDWALGVEARCRALISEGDRAEELYREAIDRLEAGRVRLLLGRAHLL